LFWKRANLILVDFVHNGLFSAMFEFYSNIWPFRLSFQTDFLLLPDKIFEAHHPFPEAISSQQET